MREIIRKHSIFILLALVALALFPLVFVLLLYGATLKFDAIKFVDSYTSLLLSFFSTLVSFFLVTVYWRYQEYLSYFQYSIQITEDYLSGIVKDAIRLDDLIEPGAQASPETERLIVSSVATLASYHQAYGETFDIHKIGSFNTKDAVALQAFWFEIRQQIVPKLAELSSVKKLFPGALDTKLTLQEIRVTAESIKSRLAALRSRDAGGIQ